MSRMTLAHALARIRAAQEFQEIAVFRHPAADALECVFARTVETYRRMRAGDSRLVGVFDGSQAPEAVEQALRPHAMATE